MNKKTKVKIELEESVKREATKDDCPGCKQHFWGSLSEQSHRSLYPSHFTGNLKPQLEKEEAASVENLKGKCNRKKESEE